MFFRPRRGHRFVGREDISAYDFTETTLTQDEAYHDLDLSAIVPVGTACVLVQFRIEHDDIAKFMKLKKKGYLTDYNAFVFSTIVAGVEHRGDCIVNCSKDRKLEYWLSTPAWSTIRLIINGWWV